VTFGVPVIHAGGPRILGDLAKFLEVDHKVFRHSWATLTEYGNVASAVVLYAARGLFEEDTLTPGAAGLVAGSAVPASPLRRRSAPGPKTSRRPSPEPSH
jgi:predicted naringenin-chalcone synthase